ncbi:hypothetical protein [Paraclostridium sordellii]|uniref:hypothetical protein n=1 Tax=Paraclostridium sordellii TaxID=1505 RepID=UPI0030CCA407
MISFTQEFFFQIMNTVLLIGLLILGYKIICYTSNFIYGLIKNSKNFKNNC